MLVSMLMTVNGSCFSRQWQSALRDSAIGESLTPCPESRVPCPVSFGDPKAYNKSRAGVRRTCVRLVHRTLAFHRPTDFIQSTLHDGETQTCPPRPRGEKRLENFIQLVLGNTAPLILDREFDVRRLSGRARKAHPNPAPVVARLEGIHEEIGNNVAGSFLTAFHQARPGVIHLQGDVSPLGFHPRD